MPRRSSEAAKAVARITGSATAAMAIIAALASSAAVAQTQPLIGAWSRTNYTQDGKPWLVTYLSFTAHGMVGLKAFYTGAPQPLVEVGQYKTDASGTSIQMVFRDFSPKQCVSVAGMTGCEPPPIPLNQLVSRDVTFMGPDTVRFSDGAVYVRAPAVP